MSKDIQRIKDKIAKRAIEAGFKSTSDFLSSTVTHTGKSRSTAMLQYHLRHGCYDLRHLMGYAKDLKMHYKEVYQLFNGHNIEQCLQHS